MVGTLDDLKLNECGVVLKLCGEESITRRLLDLGLVDGARVECVLTGAFGGVKAYWIKGALIAIRKEDAKDIFVEVV